MTKYTLVFACVFVICTYQIATVNGNPEGDKPAAGANTRQGLANKSATTAANNPTVNKGKEESEEESEEYSDDYSDEQRKKDNKPTTGVQNPVQTSITNNAAKPPTTGQKTTTTNAAKSDEESDEYSDEEPTKGSQPLTGVPNRVQTSTTNNAAIPQHPSSPSRTNVKTEEESDEYSEEEPVKNTKPITTVIEKSAATNNAATPQPTRTEDSNTKQSANQTKTGNGRKSVEESEDYSDDASDDTSYVHYKDDKTRGAKHKHKYQTPIVYYTQDSESVSGHRKGHGRSGTNTVHRRYRRKPISINIPIRIY